MNKKMLVAWLVVFVAWMVGSVIVVQPMPGAMVVKQIVLDSILIVLLGLVVAYLYRPRRA